MARALGALAALGILAGCATLNEEECRTVDWGALGDADGQRGYTQSRIGDHARACAEHGLPVDAAAYTRGWQRGIELYCTPQNGYDEGRAGARYRNSCPVELAGGFAAAYRPAKRVHDTEAEVARLEDRIDALVQELADLKTLGEPGAEPRVDALRADLQLERLALERARAEARAARAALLRYLAATPSVRPG